MAELTEHVRNGGTFRVVTHDTGRDCTRSVLAELLGRESGTQLGYGLLGGLRAFQEAGWALLANGLGGNVPTPTPWNDRAPVGRGARRERPGSMPGPRRTEPRRNEAGDDAD